MQTKKSIVGVRTPLSFSFCFLRTGFGEDCIRVQKHFSYEALFKATDKFHAGERGFGPVYKGLERGKLEDGREIVVQRLSQTSRQGTKEFQNEARLLTRVLHRNAVNLLGYCARGEDKLLV